MTLHLVFAVVQTVSSVCGVFCMCRRMTECLLTVISKLAFLPSNLIFLPTSMKLGEQDVTKMDSSLKRKGALERGMGKNRILLSSSSRIFRTDVNLAHLLHQSEFLACTEALDALLTGALRKDTMLRYLVHQHCLK